MNEQDLDFLVSVAQQPKTNRQSFVSSPEQAAKVTQLDRLGKDILKCLLQERTPGAATAGWLAEINRTARQKTRAEDETNR